MANKLELSTCASLPMFHAFTGCDTIAAFAGRWKKPSWEIWKAFPEVTEAFNELIQIQGDVSELTKSLEHFVVLLYDRSSDTMEVIEARKQLFTQKSRALEYIPPTKAALEQHIKWATYQANVWSKTVVPDPELPNPYGWSWVKEAMGCQPLWTTLPEPQRAATNLMNIVAATKGVPCTANAERLPSSALPFAHAQETVH